MVYVVLRATFTVISNQGCKQGTANMAPLEHCACSAVEANARSHLTCPHWNPPPRRKRLQWRQCQLLSGPGLREWLELLEETAKALTTWEEGSRRRRLNTTQDPKSNFAKEAGNRVDMQGCSRGLLREQGSVEKSKKASRQQDLLLLLAVSVVWTRDLKSTSHRDDIAAARASLKKNSPLLLSICSACLEHSDIASLVASKDSVCNEIQNALDAISKASQGIGNEKVQPISQSATLGSALDELENLVTLDHLPVNEDKIRPSLEKRLEGIISGAALLADSSCTRDVHRERIITECNAIRQALQDLLSEYMNNKLFFDLSMVGLPGEVTDIDFLEVTKFYRNASPVQKLSNHQGVKDSSYGEDEPWEMLSPDIKMEE
ncbi:Catenin alpha-3, partial [Varanus komodoensis]